MDGKCKFAIILAIELACLTNALRGRMGYGVEVDCFALLVIIMELGWVAGMFSGLVKWWFLDSDSC